MYGLLGAMFLWACGLGAFGDSQIAVAIGLGVPIHGIFANVRIVERVWIYLNVLRENRI